MLVNCKNCLPATEIMEAADKYTIMMELPGSGRDDIKVWQEKDVLTITADKKSPSGERIWAERVFGKFERAFQLPEDANRDKIEAGYADGIITVTIPKLEKAKPRDIEIS